MLCERELVSKPTLRLEFAKPKQGGITALTTSVR